jgi:hypothetical protein
MPTPGNIDYVLNGIGFSDATVKHAMLTITDIDSTLEDLLYVFEGKIDKLTAEIALLEDDNNFRRADTRRLLVQLNEWFWENFDKDTFHWNNFTRSVFFKRQKVSEGKQARIAASQSTPTFSTTGPTVLDFSANVMKQDAARMTSRANPGSTATLTPHKIWISPFATTVRKHVSTRTFDSTELALLSDEPTAIVKFYRYLVQLAKSAEIDLCPLSSFDSAHALWPKNRCAAIIFEMNDLLVISSPKMAF